MKKIIVVFISLQIVLNFGSTNAQEVQTTKKQFTVDGVCPPFFLRDEDGNIIDPINGIYADKPYSPKQTCGAEGCHNYELITEGYHFTQGRGEKPLTKQVERYQWVTSPGNYGGNWCSPAPLYKYLSEKENNSTRMMDMTSFSFITDGCGDCHPGGASAEYDRNGNRYDQYMKANNLESSGDNNFDGDYYKARWIETGVLEADCMLCHQPGYNYEIRKKQIANLNFRWSATAGTGWANVVGFVKENSTIKVEYDKSLFNSDGTISPKIIREPRNEACLSCHAQPGWKKRGANFSARSDVHLRAGLKCVDCHSAGSKATDERINQKEAHQFGKGDDPGGLVRNDLDNTARTCDDCHSSGYLGAPVAKHDWLPSLHMNRIACQTCHIPERLVKPSQFQASDVFNLSPKIPTKGKHLWTFYDYDMNFYNHYGNIEMMGYDDKPTDPFNPIYIRYKGKIYPVNRVHSAWPGIEVDGKQGLMQPKMSDIYKMWTDHFADNTKYPELSKIKDDNGDKIVEVNSAEEIDALIAAVTSMLIKTNYPMENKRVVWVINDKVYTSGSEFYLIPKEQWEASPYANVHKYSHDVYPAKSALGVNGCTDCHSSSSDFFTKQVLVYPFDYDAQPVYTTQNEILQISNASVNLGNFRESILKPSAPWIVLSFVSFLLFHFVICGRRKDETISKDDVLICRFKLLERMPHYFLMLSFIILGITGFLFLLGKSDPTSQWARDLHSWFGWLFVINMILMVFLWFREMKLKKEDRIWLKFFGGYFYKTPELPAGRFNAGQKIFFWLLLLIGSALAVTGGLMFFLRNSTEANLSLIYTIHDVSALFVLIFLLTHIYLGLVINPESANSIFGGYVHKSWLKSHHPNETT